MMILPQFGQGNLTAKSPGGMGLLQQKHLGISASAIHSPFRQDESNLRYKPTLYEPGLTVV